MKKSITRFLVLILIVASVFVVGRCDFSGEDEEVEELIYLNHHDSVAYVGIQTCRQCHSSIYDTYIHTGMGSSFGLADTTKSIASIGEESLLYDEHLDLYYRPMWKKDSLILREFRLADGDTSYVKEQYVDFVVGSGQHTNSHLFEINGYLYQAPFTWYAQQGRLDLPPGYEEGGNFRFDRKIGLECTSCHNSMPTEFVQGSINKYHAVPGAIDCERCHGPGEVHVQRMRRGEVVDTSKEIDYSIVNVGKLDAELQFEVCQRCHLQGNAVLAEGRSFLDFKPGMKLSEVMDIYLPRYSNAEDEFIMASHVDRFKQSRCVIEGSVGFNCISCHNPHVTVRETKVEKFNSTCKGCHGEEPRHHCTESLEKLQAADFNCVGCHMPSSTSTDIPHVTVHDHRIKIPGEEQETAEVKEFLGLVAVNNSAPSTRSKAVAYLQQYEKFKQVPYYLDSARFFLDKLGPKEENLELWVNYHFLKEDYNAIAGLVQSIGSEEVQSRLNEQDYENREGWAAYRIGEAYYRLDRLQPASRFYAKAVKLVPYNPDFMSKYALSLATLDSVRSAIEVYEKALAEMPKHKEALNNLGFQYLRAGEIAKGKEYIDLALAQDPDYEIAWLNKANIAMLQDNEQEAEHALEEVLRINPQNARARSALAYLKQEN